MEAPRDNLLRALHAPETVELRAAEGAGASTGDVMTGHFAVFDTWTEIHSWFEGDFMERIAPGAFKDTLTNPERAIRVLYDHGADPQIGNKPLGTPDVVKEDARGVYYEVGLFDASYVNDLKPAIRAGQLGASFRFKVTADEWVEPQKSTERNAAKLPERTITGIGLYEFGPVTFGQYDEATAGMRSRTDEFFERMLHDPLFVARFAERVGPGIAERLLKSVPVDAPHEPQADKTVDDLEVVRTIPDIPLSERRAFLARLI